MPGIEIKGRSKIANYRHGGRTGKFGGGRTNLLEQLGRVEAEPSNRNRRAEISRVHGELNRGYNKGGRVGKAIGGWTLKRPVQKLLEGIGGGSEKKPHSTRAGRISAGVRKIKRGVKEAAEPFVKEAITLEKLRKRKLGPRAGKGKSPGRPKKTWPPKYKDLLQRYPKVPQPHKSPGDIKYIPKPKDTRGEPMIPAAKGGRIGLQSGGPHPEKVKKWITRPGKRKPTGKPPKAGGKSIINPKYQETYRPPQQKKSELQDFSRKRKEFKKGGSDKKWMQKVSASIKKRGTKGKCTPITKPGCTGRAKALAKTFKKIAAKRKA